VAECSNFNCQTMEQKKRDYPLREGKNQTARGEIGDGQERKKKKIGANVPFGNWGKKKKVRGQRRVRG